MHDLFKYSKIYITSKHLKVAAIISHGAKIMNEDIELLRSKKLIKMLAEQIKNKINGPKAPLKSQDPIKIIAPLLTDKARDVLEQALIQYPIETKAVLSLLAKYAASSKLPTNITGEELLALFHRLGIYVRMPTRIFVKERNEVKPLGEKIKEKLNRGS